MNNLLITFNDAATKKYVDDNMSSGGGSGAGSTTSRLTVNSNINMKDRYRILNLKSPLEADEPATKQYADSTFLDRDGSHAMIGDLSMNNNRITNLPNPIQDSQPVTRGYGNANYLRVGSNIDLAGSYNVQNSKKRTYNQLKSDTRSLVSYDEVKDNFVSINESIGMKTYLDMGDNFIKRVKTPTSNDQASNKSYVDTVGSNTMSAVAMIHPTKQEIADYLKKDGTVAMTGNLNMNNNRIFNLPAPTGNNQPTPLSFTNLKYLAHDGTTPMTNNLNMDNKKIINLRPPTSNTDATTKKYVDDLVPDTSSFFEKRWFCCDDWKL